MGLTFAVVAIESVAVTGDEPVTLTVEGVIVQVPPVGQFPVKSSTEPVNPYRGVMVSVAVPVCPGAETFTVAGFADRLKSVMLIETAAEVDPA